MSLKDIFSPKSMVKIMRILQSANFVCRALTVLVIGGAWGSVLAQPAPPPVVCVDDTDCVETVTGGGGPTGSYSFASIGNVPFAYSTPIPPAITSEVTVTPATLAANKVNGRRVILSAGNYGNQTFNTQDQEIVFQDGVVFGFLTIDSSAARLAFRGRPARAGVTGYIRVGSSTAAARDILFDGITQRHIQEGGQYPRQDNDFNVQRLGIINSSFQAYGFVVLSYSGSSNRLTDVVIANNNLEDRGSSLPGTGYGQAAIRMQGAARIVFVDNRLYGYPGDSFQNFRIHAQPGLPAENFYLARNQFEGTGHSFQRSGDGSATQEIRNLWFEDNVQYTTVLSPINVGNGTSAYPTSFTLRNNILYSTVGGWPSIPSGFSWQFSGNSTSAYQTPPAWLFK